MSDRELEQNDACFQCDWPKERSRILSDVGRLTTGEERAAEILSKITELTVEVRNLNEKIANGNSFAQREVRDIREVLHSHALKIEQLNGKSMLWSGMGGGMVVTLAGIALALIYTFVKH